MNGQDPKMISSNIYMDRRRIYSMVEHFMIIVWIRILMSTSV